MIKWISVVLAIAGTALGLYAVADSDKPQPIPELAGNPSVNPFAKGIAALGIVEPVTRAVGVFAPEAGSVASVKAEVNAMVKQGDELFRLDTRALESQRVRAQAAVVEAQAQLERLRALPRPEDVAPVEAELRRIDTESRTRAEELAREKSAAARGASNEWNVRQLELALEKSQADLARARAELARIKAGAWAQDLTIAEASLDRARAEVRSVELLMDRLIVRSPIDGTVLKRDLEPGEYVSPGTGLAAPVVVGDVRELRVRARVDEEDIVALREGARPRASARVRGVSAELFDLEFIRIEPLARPKNELTGANAERVDTRVVDVLFRVTRRPGSPLFAGQAVDVFIDAQPSGGAAQPTGAVK